MRSEDGSEFNQFNPSTQVEGVTHAHAETDIGLRAVGRVEVLGGIRAGYAHGHGEERALLLGVWSSRAGTRLRD
jgi:hypothetical protein